MALFLWSSLIQSLIYFSPKLSENVKINIRSVKPFTEFSYHVLTTMGRVILSDTIQVDSTTNYEFEFTPTHDMEADMKIIVFYIITDYGEVVADSLLLEFNEKRNFVSKLHENGQLGRQTTFDEPFGTETYFFVNRLKSAHLMNECIRMISLIYP